MAASYHTFLFVYVDCVGSLYEPCDCITACGPDGRRLLHFCGGHEDVLPMVCLVDWARHNTRYHLKDPLTPGSLAAFLDDYTAAPKEVDHVPCVHHVTGTGTGRPCSALARRGDGGRRQ